MYIIMQTWLCHQLHWINLFASHSWLVEISSVATQLDLLPHADARQFLYQWKPRAVHWTVFNTFHIHLHTTSQIVKLNQAFPRFDANQLSITIIHYSSGEYNRPVAIWDQDEAQDREQEGQGRRVMGQQGVNLFSSLISSSLSLCFSFARLGLLLYSSPSSFLPEMPYNGSALSSHRWRQKTWQES